ncbi:MAG: serine hydrolase domain-containing protein [Bacteroidota bacterium]
MNKLILLCLLLGTSLVSAQRATTITHSEHHPQIDAYVQSVITQVGIPGLAVAVIKDNRIIHQQNYGYANLEHQVPVSDASIFRVYSLTKPIVAVGVFQLMENGDLRLEDKVSKYVPDLPKAWQGVRIKHLLSHSAGLPDMAPIPDFQDLTEEQAVEKVFALPCRFKPGEEYDYNQTGFWLLKRVIEKITGEELAAWIAAQQFPSPCDTAFFSSDSRDIIRHRATPYFPFTKGTLTLDHSYLQGTYAHAQNGLNISLEAFIKWDQRLRNNEFLRAETRDRMWEIFPYTKSNKVFTYGWDKHQKDGRISYGFSGSLVTAYRVFPAENMSIIFLSNGLTEFYNIERIMDEIARLALVED